MYFGGDTGCCSIPRPVWLRKSERGLLDAADDDDELDSKGCKRCPVFAEIGKRYGPIDLV